MAGRLESAADGGLESTVDGGLDFSGNGGLDFTADGFSKLRMRVELWRIWGHFGLGRR